MSTSSAPLEVGRVALTVNDIGQIGDFYQSALGLERMGGSGEVVTLGAGNRVLLELRADRGARRRTSQEAGLFHTAFLMPDRPALARWLHHAATTRVPIQGASDHIVSEAIYLADPEGNGIEVYVDRPRSTWTTDAGGIYMATEMLDLNNLASAADGPWTGAPEGAVVGHVHLQVGTLPEAEAFYSGTLGFPITTHYPGAAFFGSGGYHHHLATNIWNSRGARTRSYPSTGVADVEILADPAELSAIRARAANAANLVDPWGTSIILTEKAA